MKVLFATNNAGKLRELKALLAPLDVEVVSLQELGVALEVDEDQPTFAGNAEKKARAAVALTKMDAIADDSGLEVDALDGAPGIYSARYAGAGHDDAANNAKLIGALEHVPTEKRSARFRCSLAFVDVAGHLETADGVCEGSILAAPRGAGGFGYDPLFLVAGGTQSMAELASAEKNRISHRAPPCGALAAKLGEYFRAV